MMLIIFLLLPREHEEWFVRWREEGRRRTNRYKNINSFVVHLLWPGTGLGAYKSTAYIPKHNSAMRYIADCSSVGLLVGGKMKTISAEV